jgi:hypothetical protein
MKANTLARSVLAQEARALLTRLGRIRPFALQETMLPAAALSPAAQIAIERFLIGSRYRLRQDVLDYICWLRDAPRGTSPAEMQRRFTIVRLRFNDALTQFDVFSELITQRSEHDTGLWLAGLDVLAADALGLPGNYFEPPQGVVCYLARGPGAAIRRARTRLPGGGRNPVAIIRVPRERMVGHGIASSLVHEVGHQVAALLQLVESIRPLLQAQQSVAAPAERAAWGFWGRWISEIVADLWSIAKIGIGSTLGLIGVVSLPSWFVFRANADDPHPMPWIRVKLSCAIGDALYPHPQWRELAALWEELYPPSKLDVAQQRLLAALEATFPRFVALLVDHRPRSLHGRSLREVTVLAEREPDRLAGLWRRCRREHGRLRDLAPSLAFAVLGQARALGDLSAERESRTVENLLTYWALRSTLEIPASARLPGHPAVLSAPRLAEAKPVQLGPA